jgi:hypothetical protein
MMNGQAGIEFFVYVSLVLLLLSIFLYSSYSKQAELMEIRIENEVREIAESAAFEINSAVKAGDGYERRFNMKDYYSTLRDFNITILGNTVEVNFGNKHHYGNLLTDRIVGNFTLDWNRIRNDNGVIYVN